MSVLMRLSRERIDKVIAGEITVLAMDRSPALERADVFYLVEAETKEIVARAYIGQKMKVYISKKPAKWCHDYAKGTGYSLDELCMMANSGVVGLYNIVQVVSGFTPIKIAKVPLRWQYWGKKNDAKMR